MNVNVSSNNNNDDNNNNNNNNGSNEVALDLNVGRILKLFESSFIFAFLVVSIYMQKHAVGIFVFLILTIIVMRAESRIVETVGSQDPIKKLMLLATGLSSIAHCVFIYKAWPRSHLLDRLFLIPPTEIMSFSQCLWSVLMNDLGVRFFSMFICSISLLCLPIKRSRAICKSIFALSLLIRSVVPVPVWSAYLSTLEYGQIQASGTVSLYTFFKILNIYPLFKRYIQSITDVFKSVDTLGELVTRESLMEEGIDDRCVICLGNFTRPIKLPCSHIFCESCIEMWLMHNTTCPMCRQIVPGANSITNSIVNIRHHIAQLF